MFTIPEAMCWGVGILCRARVVRETEQAVVTDLGEVADVGKEGDGEGEAKRE